MTILQHIMAKKLLEVARAKKRLPETRMRDWAEAAGPVRGFKQALQAGDGPNIIAEVKRASPSRGVLRPHDPPDAWQPEGLAHKYEQGGAVCLSVLTDVHFFWGHPDALGACREATLLPVLRKDFIADVYQVDESRWLGADAILLIVRVLDPGLLRDCAQRALALGMDVLLEVHDEHELPVALSVEEGIIGVNNRDLSNFSVDANRTARLRQRVQGDRLLVAESGLSEPLQLQDLMSQGIDGFLIGEALVRSDDPTAQLRYLRGL